MRRSGRKPFSLRETLRILKAGGVLIAAAISRFASLLDGLARGFFEDPELGEIVATDLTSGQHRNPTHNNDYFTTTCFHRSDELAGELREAGFTGMEVLSVEGPVWSTGRFADAWRCSTKRALAGILSLIAGRLRFRSPART